MLGLNKVARRIFGSENERKLKSAWATVEKINALEDEIKALSDDALRGKTVEFRSRLAAGETLDKMLPEAFAVVREGARRSIGLRHFDVQLVGGMILHQGKIAEMKTGEGKTLVATLPVYLNALEEKGVHVVTVNDYLAKRDAAWMGQVYSFLGMSTGVVVPGMDDEERKAAYACDITYATNNELGFDYLRDNMKYSLETMAQRARRRFAIVDEVDSILIDEARTPLIISGPTEDQSELYVRLDALVKDVSPEDFELDEKQRTVAFTEDGAEKLEQSMREAGLLAEDATMYDPQNVGLVHHSNQALRAHTLFQKDKDYIVKDGEVVIIDEFTGRMMKGRRYSEGLHQALEAKEKVEIQPENVTLASVTFQNYFRLYDKLAGMTGTAMTEADEFAEIYKLDVLEVPTNKPIAREDEDDLVFRTADEKFDAIIEAIREGNERRQPILVGTTSIEKSEMLSEILKKKGVEHNVLNARFHEQEAHIVAQAGRPGAVTIATNMAGRGTDIQLGGNPDMMLADELAKQGVGPDEEDKIAGIRAKVMEDVAKAKTEALEAGGLWVISTERHESRRIDNQLRGRSGRQGDPGRSTFFLSLQDDLMRIFGSERMDGMLRRLGLQDGEAIVHPWVNKAIERSQAKVEARNFEIRKNLLKYDDVMNDQRRAIFDQRLEIMEADDVSEMVRDMRHTVVEDFVARHIPERSYAEQWDLEGLEESMEQMFGVRLPVKKRGEEEGVDDEVMIEWLAEETDKIVAKKIIDLSRDMGTDVDRAREMMRDVEKAVVLQTIDHHWREHLSTLDQLRSVIGLRGYGQRDPLNEYKSEAFTLFEALLSQLRGDVVQQLMNVRFAAPPELEEPDFEETSVNITLGGEPEKEPAEAAAGAGGAPAKKKRGRTRRVGKGRR